MTMTDEPTTQPEVQDLECPRCGSLVAATMTQREGVTVMEVAPHECQPKAEVLPATRPPEHEQASVGVRTAIDAAAEAALANPGMPGRDEFLNLAAQARMLHLSGGAPELIRKDPYLAFHVVLVGRDLGISPSAAMALIDVIPSSNGPQLSLSPQLLNGQIRRLRLGQIIPGPRSARAAIAIAIGPNGHVDDRCKLSWPAHVLPDDPRGPCTCRGILGDSEFTWEDAQMAGLAGKNCQPGEHSSTKGGRGDGGCGCNQGYRTYPKRMMWWRAGGFCADDYFPEAGLGLYSPEELGAVVDDEGRPIDVTSVELPPGFQPEPPPPPAEADLDELWALQERIHALPDDAKLTLRQRWEERIQGSNGRPIPAWALSADKLNLANALLRGAEAGAKAMKVEPRWDPETALATTRAEVGGVVGAILGWLHGVVPSESPDPGPGGAGPAAPDETPPPVPEGAQEPAEGPDPAAAFKEKLADATDAQVDEAIEAVKALDARGVDKELTRLRQNAEGHINDRRRRLGLALLYEALHGGPPPEQIP